MTDYSVKRFILALAIQADIEAMKMDNYIRQLNGNETFNYNPEAFDAKAEELRDLAYMHDEQL